MLGFQWLQSLLSVASASVPKQLNVSVTQAKLSSQLTSCITRHDSGLAFTLHSFFQQGLQNLSHE